ncbi:hypothetical protein [Paenibacillus macerans]|uniref:hypothetical protein n=1 Tax=Paenibacillus macerans TaxID=44252 RepID=UPI003D30F4F1
MTKPKSILLIAALAAVLTLSACGTRTLTGAPENNANPANTEQNAENGTTGVTDPAPANADQGETDQANTENGATNGNDAANAAAGDEQILIIIDQTPKPIAEGGSFDFQVAKAPEGYVLKEMKWVSDNNNIVNTLEEAIQHGQNGGDGFYISGDGQFMGFFYPDEMKGEKGKAAFVFANEQGKELSWEKEITLQ